MRATYAAALSITLLLTACGGGGSSPAPPPPPPPPGTITSVTVSGNAAVVKAGEMAFFTATVTGTGAFNNTVTWSVNGTPGGDAVNGTITGGNYTAPPQLPPANPVTIAATSVQDATKFGSAAISVFTIAISPPTATVFYNHTQQFTATVAGVANPVVQWFTQYGAVDATGLYSAPTFGAQNGADTVYARLENSGVPATAAVTLQFPPPVLQSITPNGASANEPVTIRGQDLYGTLKVFFPGPNGTMLWAPISDPPTLTQIDTTVPLGAVSGDVVVQFNATGAITTASVSFTRLPNLRIRAGTKDLSSGETVQFQHRLLGPTGSQTVHWTADLGAINGTGLYQAPTVSQESFATVTACLQQTRSCDSTMLRILPLRIAPAAPVVSLGQSLQLNAIEGSSVSANWSVLAGGGSVTSGGLFTAPTNPLQAGPVPVSATAGTGSEIAPIAVTSAFPGLVSRTYDYMNFGFDPQQQEYLQRMEGTLVRNLTVAGNRAYALDWGLRSSPPFAVNPPFTALEVYDISDPNNPVWLSAAESIIGGPTLFSTYGRYLVEVDTGTMPGSIYNTPSRIALYDVQSSPPRLVSYADTPDLYLAINNNGLIYGTPLNSYQGPTAPFFVFDVRSGTIQQTQISVPPPADTLAGAPPWAVIGTGNLIYAGFVLQSGGAVIAAYDVSTSPPTLLGSTPVAGLLLPGFTLLIRGHLLFANNSIFDISNAVPVQVGALPTQRVKDVQGTSLLGVGFPPSYTPQANYLLVDIKDPANPVIKASVYDRPDSVDFTGQFVGNGEVILSSDGLGGIATIDLSGRGGLIDKARVEVFPGGVIFDHAINQQTIYVAGVSGLGAGGLITFDFSTGTPILVGGLLYSLNEGFAVQVTGNTAFLGLLDSLKVLDVSNAADPVEIASLTLPTNALALSGDTLFDGTRDGRLVALNVTNPNTPITLASVPLPSAAVNLRLVGSTLFVADGPAGLLIFDVSNPAAPRQLSQLALSTPVWDIAPSGSLAFLAADSAGLVIADISNLWQPKQISQTTLESWNPFPYFLDEGPRSLALSVAVQNGLVYVGTANSLGLVFAFDYAQPIRPRLVSMNAFGEFIDTLVSGFSFLGNDLYAFGGLGVDDDIVQSDNSAPRNTIDLYYPPLALRSITFISTGVADTKTKHFVHPKFDRQIFQRRHLQPRAPKWRNGIRTQGPECLSENIIEEGTYDGTQTPTSALAKFFDAIYDECGHKRPKR